MGARLEWKSSAKTGSSLLRYTGAISGSPLSSSDCPSVPSSEGLAGSLLVEMVGASGGRGMNVASSFASPPPPLTASSSSEKELSVSEPSRSMYSPEGSGNCNTHTHTHTHTQSTHLGFQGSR